MIQAESKRMARLTVDKLQAILVSILGKLARYDEGTLFASFLSFTVSGFGEKGGRDIVLYQVLNQKLTNMPHPCGVHVTFIPCTCDYVCDAHAIRESHIFGIGDLYFFVQTMIGQTIPHRSLNN